MRSPRLTLAEIAAKGSLDASGNLTVDGQRVAVAYFRAGYAPTDYPSEAEWQARRVISSSLPVICTTPHGMVLHVQL